jgi:hypothetical protein
MARAPDEADHGNVVVLRNLTDFTLGDARQVEHHDASVVEREKEQAAIDAAAVSERGAAAVA